MNSEFQSPESLDFFSAQLSPPPAGEDHSEVFDGLLRALNLDFTADEHFYSVGNGRPGQDQLVCISVIYSQVRKLLELLLPYLAEQRLAFKVVKNLEVAKLILNGNFGYQHIGKLIILYLPEAQREQVIGKLVELTYGFKGPAIPGFSCIGGLLYASRSGGAEKKQGHQRYLRFDNTYLVTRVLKMDAKGSVFKAFYIKSWLSWGSCLIKQGKSCMWSDEAGRDIADRLRWQKSIHERLSDLVRVPRIIDFFEDKGDTYLVMEYIKGITLSQQLNEIYNELAWPGLAIASQTRLLEILLSVLSMLDNFHRAGFVHRDLNPANFILDKKERLVMIDLELVYDLKTAYPMPVFRLGTAGFMSPEQFNSRVPTIKEDVYAFGSFMVMFFTGKLPTAFDLEDKDRLLKQLYELTGELKVGQLILKCLAEDPSLRPGVKELSGFFRERLGKIKPQRNGN